MNWRYVTDPCGGYYWYSDRLPNGWSACVADHTQSCAPQQTTAYSASAVCRWWIVGYHSGRLIDTLAEAKRVAVHLALQQGVACDDPQCRSDYRPPAQPEPAQRGLLDGGEGL